TPRATASSICAATPPGPSPSAAALPSRWSNGHSSTPASPASSPASIIRSRSSPAPRWPSELSLARRVFGLRSAEGAALLRGMTTRTMKGVLVLIATGAVACDPSAPPVTPAPAPQTELPPAPQGGDDPPPGAVGDDAA